MQKTGDRRPSGLWRPDQQTALSYFFIDSSKVDGASPHLIPPHPHPKPKPNPAAPPGSPRHSHCRPPVSHPLPLFFSQHYRGPVPMATLHMLFAESVISARTYVFAEHLSNEREWIRIERVPTLLEALSQPFDDTAEEPEVGQESSLSSVSNAPAAWTAPARSRQSMDAGQPGLKLPMVGAPAGASAPAPAQPLLDEHAPVAFHAPCVATSRVDVTLLPANVSVSWSQ